MGDLEGALQTASALPAGTEKARALLEIGKAQYKLGNKAEARRILRRASRAAAAEAPRERRGNSNPDWAKSNLLEQIAAEQARAGDSEEVDATLQDVPAGESMMLAGVILAYAEVGDFNRATQMLTQIKKPAANREYSLTRITGLMTKAGNEKGALALANEQSTPALKAHAFLGILEAKLPKQEENE